MRHYSWGQTQLNKLRQQKTGLLNPWLHQSGRLMPYLSNRHIRMLLTALNQFQYRYPRKDDIVHISSPIPQDATDIHQQSFVEDTGEVHSTHVFRNIRSLSQALLTWYHNYAEHKQDRGKIVADCHMGVQLAYNWLLFLFDPNATQTTHFSTQIPTHTHDACGMVYLGLGEKEIYQDSQKIDEADSKGEWLLQVQPDKYIGLVPDGFICLSLAQWKTYVHGSFCDALYLLANTPKVSAFLGKHAQFSVTDWRIHRPASPHTEAKRTPRTLADPPCPPPGSKATTFPLCQEAKVPSILYAAQGSPSKAQPPSPRRLDNLTPKSTTSR